MKPFNLEEAKAGKKVVTRDGQPARIVGLGRAPTNLPIMVLIESFMGEEYRSYSANGKLYEPSVDSDNDLFMADEEPESEVTDLQKWCKEILPIVQAGANGEEIEIFNQVEWDNKVSLIFNSAFKYRIKPKVKTVNGFEVPMHETVAPAVNATYYTPDIHDKSCNTAQWLGDSCDLKFLASGIVYLDKESATKYAKAMLGINPEEE